MENWYLVCEDNIGKGVNHAGAIAKNDIMKSLDSIGIKRLYINRRVSSNKVLNKVYSVLIDPLKIVVRLLRIKKTETIVVQHPMMRSMKMNSIAIRLAKRIRKFDLVTIIHDLDHLRFYYNRKKRELRFLKAADYIICHNDKMKAYLIDAGFSESQLVVLEAFDYLIQDGVTLEGGKENQTLIVAGGLSREKAGYIYSLNEDGRKPIKLNLYGRWFDESYQNNDVKYFGAFDSNDLPHQLQGQFGLVWDGPDFNTCSGETGEYLKYNNPHKVSLYLACGFPVIIWKEAAMATFIVEQKLGFAVGSLTEIEAIFEKLGTEEYELIVQNVNSIASKIRSGYFIIKAVQQINNMNNGE